MRRTCGLAVGGLLAMGVACAPEVSALRPTGPSQSPAPVQPQCGPCVGSTFDADDPPKMCFGSQPLPNPAHDALTFSPVQDAVVQSGRQATFTLLISNVSGLDLPLSITFISGLYNEQALKGNIHSSQTGNLLSGAPLADGGGIRSGTSFDQIIA